MRESKLFIARNRAPVAIAVAGLLSIGVMGALFTQHIGQQKKEVNDQRARADQLFGEVEILDHEHESYVQETELAKQQLAKSLTGSAKQLKNLAIFDRPVATIKQTRQMVITALQQNPNCVEAYAQLLALDCLQLDYKRALERLPVVKHTAQYGSYAQLVRAFPDFDFSQNKRPSVNQLADFFRNAREVNPNQSAHLERVMAYDYDARTDKEEYVPVVEAFLQYKFGGPSCVTLKRAPEPSTLSLWSNRSISLKGRIHSGRCLLAHLSFRFLKLEIRGAFSLSDLNELPIESLDISGCARVRLSNEVYLPHLRTLYVRGGRFATEFLLRQIRSNAPFEIVEVDGGPNS